MPMLSRRNIGIFFMTWLSNLHGLEEKEGKAG
jgi:hypothetical protein